MSKESKKEYKRIIRELKESLNSTKTPLNFYDNIATYITLNFIRK